MSTIIPNKLIKLANTIPEAEPTKIAGEKIPPKKPVDKKTLENKSNKEKLDNKSK